MKKNQAFTIVETLVTLLAITIMIAGPLTFMYRSYYYAEFVKVRLVATGLAQEGLELATSLRNDNLANFISIADSCSAGCMADWDGVSTAPVFVPCTDSSCQLFRSSTDPDTLYRRNGDEATGYHRLVKFTPDGHTPTQGYMVESVSWYMVDQVRVEASLKKMIFNIVIK